MALAVLLAAFAAACGSVSDLSSSCPVSQVLCGGLCVELASSDEHCGACDRACGSGQRCEGGECVAGVVDAGACGLGTTECDGGCVDIRLDPEHCGGCGQSCEAGLACLQGQCTLTCSGGTTQCGGVCVDTAFDPRNCGACGSSCGPGLLCAEGICSEECTPATTECDGACVDTDSNLFHCGACDNPCLVGQACAGGECIQTCGDDRETCSGACTNVALDPDHCGACDSPCESGLVCSEGECALTCSGNTTRCGDVCVQTESDPQNCGECGEICGPDEACVDGECSPCLGGESSCSGTCIDTSSHLSHCGGCGQACPHVFGGSATCSDGECGGVCLSGRADCDGDASDCETSLSFNRDNCGGCGVVCDETERCSGSACVACGAGLQTCGNSCTDKMTDRFNCGECGNSCPTLSGTSAVCEGGMCKLVCRSGFVNCNGDMSDGCEVSVSSDRENCGTCGHQCAPDELCSSGLCSACPGSQTVCGSFCRDLSSDRFNCGACDLRCTFTTHQAVSSCQDGECVLDCNAGHLDCDTNALNGCETPFGHDHCGSCGAACAADEFCSKSPSCTPCAPTVLDGALPITTAGTTIGRSDAFQTPCGSGNAPEAYFSFTAPSAGSYTFDTAGSAFDTVLQLRNTACRGPSLGCNNDTTNTPQSALTVTLAAGQTVIVIVDGWFSSQGEFVLRVQ